MSKVLFVCHGNVQRSQMAEGYYNYLTNSRRGASAGVDATTPKKYSSPHQETVSLMAEEGIDVSHQTVKMVTPEMVEAAERIYVMTRQNLPDFLANCPKVTYWNIQDPFGQPMEVVRQVQQEVKDHVAHVVATESAVVA